MRLQPIIALLIAAGCLAGKCEKQDKMFGSYVVDSPIQLAGIEAVFAKDIPYDSFSETNFDIFLPQTTGQAPLVIYFHGGGFVGGDKADMYAKPKDADEIRALLSKGIAFATVNYRLLQPGDTDGVRKPLNDARRCLQFIRHHASDFRIDKDRIGLYGASAGAGAALWIAFNDDMADPTATDPVLRSSTRVKAVAAFAAQATYDLKKWETVVFQEYNMPLTDMIALAGGQRILGFYGIASAAEFNTPAIEAYRAEVDLQAFLSSDDPPIWMENRNAATGAPTDRNELFHHYKHAEVLIHKAAAAGVYHTVNLPAKPFRSADWRAVEDFFAERL